MYDLPYKPIKGIGMQTSILFSLSSLRFQGFTDANTLELLFFNKCNTSNYFEIVLSCNCNREIQVLKTQDSEDTAQASDFECELDVHINHCCVSAAVKLIKHSTEEK